MSIRLFCTVFTLLVLAGLAFSQGGKGSSESVGSLPVPTLHTEPNPCASNSKVKPGAQATNNDGVGVSNGSASNGDATLSPGDGQGGPNCASNVVTRNGFKGLVSGLDSNDTGSIGANNETTVTGTGGLISLSGHSTVTVTNTAPAGSTSTIGVVLPSGTTVNVPAQTSQTFNT